jgi:ribonuclease E
MKIVRHGARAASAETPAAPSTPPASKEYEVVNDAPTEKKKGWWNRLVE